MSNSIDFAEAILDFKSRNAEELKRDAAEIRQRIFGIRDAMKDVDKHSQAFANLSAQLRQAGREAFVLREALAAKPTGGSMLGDIGKMASAIGAATIATRALNASWDMVIGTIGKGIKLSAELERAKVTMGFALKDQAGGGQVIEAMRALALENPLLNSQQTTGLANQFVTKGLVTSIDDLRKKITILGDVASTSSGLSQDVAMDRIMYALGQVAIAKKIDMQDMRQITNANIGANPMDIIAKGMGITRDQLAAANKRGEISGKEAFEAFFKGAEKMFGGAAMARANTFEGTWARLSEQWDVSTQKIGEQWVEPLKRVMNKLIDMGDNGSLQSASKTIATSVESVVNVLLWAAKSLEGIQKESKNLGEDIFLRPFLSKEAMAKFKQDQFMENQAQRQADHWDKVRLKPGQIMGQDAPAMDSIAKKNARDWFNKAVDNTFENNVVDWLVGANRPRNPANERNAADMKKAKAVLWGMAEDFGEWWGGLNNPTKNKIAAIDKQLAGMNGEKAFEFKTESADQMWQRIQQDIFKKPDDQKQILLDQKKALEEQLKKEEAASTQREAIKNGIQKLVDNFPKAFGWA